MNDQNQFDLGVRAGHFLSMKDGSEEVQENIFIGIKFDKISAILPFEENLRLSSKEFIDASDKIVMPGLINAHTHLPMSLFRGFQDDVSFHDWLYRHIFPAEQKLVDQNFVKVGTELSMLECIRFGTTTVNEMYFYTETTAEVIEKAGIRGILAWPFMDHATPDEKNLGDHAISSRKDRFKKFNEKYSANALITPALGPHAPYTCSDETLLFVKALSEEFNLLIHMHVCETETEVKESLEKYNMTPIERLYRLGLLNERLIMAHCVHISSHDLELIKVSGAKMIYNPDSNLKLGSGVAQIVKYRENGILVALGSDGAASNNDLSLFGAMDLGTKLQKNFNQDSTAMLAIDALRMATLEGAKVLGMDKEIGSLEVGKKADLICLRTDLPHVNPLHSVLSQLVYAYQGLEVDSVICNGRVLLLNGNHLTINAQAVYAQARAICKQMNQTV